MTSPERTSSAPDANAVARPFLPLLVLLFVGSGCAALIYEIVWFQSLQLMIGSNAVAIGVLLGVFMGGMGLGAILFARRIAATEHPLRVYAKLELGIAICGLLIPLVLPLVGSVYLSFEVHGFAGILLRGFLCGICLLPPTLLMGATLPALSRWVKATPSGVAWLGFFYSGNIAGGVIGSLLAGYYLLRVFDMYTAGAVAVVLNVIVAAVAFSLSKKSAPVPSVPSTSGKGGPLFVMPPGTWPIYLTIGLSGLTALGSEVVWTRLVSLLLGATTYTFSLILGVFLIGLGLGSSAGSFIARTTRNPRAMLGWCQVVLLLALLWAGWSVTTTLPLWPVNADLVTVPSYVFQMDFIKAAWVVLPGAILWGASFPLALAAAGLSDEDPARLVGTVYACNTLGGIIGSLFFSIIAISHFGTQTSQRILVVIAAISALVALVIPSGDGKTSSKQALTATIAVLVLGALSILNLRAPPALLIAYGRNSYFRNNDHGEFIFWGEGMNSSMAVSRLSNGVLNYHNAGKVQASSEPQDMRLQRMLGHLTTLLPTTPSRVLVIGCGAGVTAGAVSIEPRLGKETIAEIEPLVPDVVSKYFSEHNFSVVSNPKVHVEYDDARHYLFTTKDKFDAITSDPFDPWVKGAATLYTKEFFTEAKKHLNPGGVVTVFVQLYESTESAVKSEVATFLDVFPDGMIFANTYNGAGYDVVMVGRADGSKPIDVDAVQARLSSPEYAQVAQSLAEIGFTSAVDLFSTYAAQKDQLKAWLADAQVNRDRNLRLQYLAGLGLNLYDQGPIYANMIKARQYPEGLFVGSPETLAALRLAIASRY